MACSSKSCGGYRMKQAFSTSWNSSVQPRKQRKYRFNAPTHIRQKFMTVNLSKTLRKEHKRRNIEARKGDKVKIMRGSFKGHSGIIERVDRKLVRIYVNGAETTKKDGSKTLVPQSPSKLQLISLDLKDKRRLGESKPSKTTTKQVSP